MQKFDNLAFVFTGNPKEFEQYILELVNKPWVIRFDILEKGTAALATSKQKIVLLKNVVKATDINSSFSRFGSKLNDRRAEIITTGTWYDHRWIVDTLRQIKEQHPNLKFKSAYIGTKPS